MDDESFVMTEKIIEKGTDFIGWHPEMHEFPGTVNEYGNFKDAYTRVKPERFDGDSADTNYYPVDKFTQNMLNKYAVEGHTDKKGHPQPTGHFTLTADTARTAAAEVVCTHFSKCGKDGDDYLSKYFQDAWNYYDVNREGKIDAIGVSQFFRFLTRPLGDIDLQ
jgi:hypothetical protein